MPKKGIGQFTDLWGAWQEIGRGVFFRGHDTPMHTMYFLQTVTDFLLALRENTKNEPFLTFQ